MAFHFSEDFKLHDECGRSYFVDIEEHSAFTHGHARIMEDGKYHLLLNGNTHFLTTPPLRDFRLEMDFSMKFLNTEFGYGFLFYFRYDRALRKGHTLRCLWDKTHLLRILVDDAEIQRKSFAALPDFSALHAVFELKGEKAALEFLGEKFSFECPEKADLPEKGGIGFDLEFAPSSSMTVSKIVLDSDDALTKTHQGRKLEFVLKGVQGFTEPIRYAVDVESYGDGYVELDCVLAGTIRGRGQRADRGGQGWCYEINRLTRPYLRIESEGQEYRNIFFDNGQMLLMDPEEGRLCVKLFPNIPWPLHMRIVCRNFPKTYTVAAGYEYACQRPWCFAANGPYEQIRDMNGNFIYEGDSLRGRLVSVQVKSPEDKMLVSRIPAGIPEYEKALKHAREQHYFYDDETVSFELGAFFRKEFYAGNEFKFECSVQDPYERDIEGCALKIADADWKSPADFLACVSKKIVLKGHLKSGVYHLKTVVKAEFKTVYDDYAVFEVLPEAPDAPPPPIASGLPLMLSMNNEVKNLETDAFDPLEDWGGCAHYYSMVMRYPAVGKDLRIWELLKVYHRKWFLMLSRRNAKDFEFSDSNIELIRHADYLDMNDPKRVYDSYPQFLHLQLYYAGYMLPMLKDFLLEKKPPLKLTTPAIIDAIIAQDPKRGHISAQQLGEIVEKAWDEWVAFMSAIIARENLAFTKKILAINPKIARGGYGPWGLYASNYKSAYSVRLGRNGQRVDPVTNANGSFFFLEDYHLSCDYPITKPSFFVTSYKLICPEGRKLYPEIYYGGGVGCNDGAVYQAHPPYGIYDVYDSHQRRIVYTFGYASPYYRNGAYDYWRDYGFHCPTPYKNSFRHFLHAWGNLLRNKPSRQLPAPFMAVDPGLFRLHGDYMEDACNYSIPTLEAWSDTGNTAEEAMAYSFMELSSMGFNTPVQTLAAEIDSLTKEMTSFLILPPIVKGTSSAVVASIRRAHERGIGLLAFESVHGLEDLFGVKEKPEAVVVRRSGDEVFFHKCAVARYDADGAEVLLSGASQPEGSADIALVLARKTKSGRTAFFNVPPSVVRREDYRQKLGFGQSSISASMKDALKRAAEYLDPHPAVKAERGAINACVSVNGDVIVTLSEDSRGYGDTTPYPVTFRFRVAFPGIGNAQIEADAPYAVVEKGDGHLVIRIETEKDTGLFFKFSIPSR